MHAIVRQGNGKYYVSAVFGYYREIPSEDPESSKQYRDAYWIVWDEEKKRLIRWMSWDPNAKSIVLQVLVVDSDQSNWNMDEHGIGCVDFLSKELLDSLLDEEEQPEEILEKCRAMDAGYVYDSTPEIRTQKDIEDLEWAVGGFHDAYLDIEELQEDGTLYLRFSGTWECEVEVWFWGDLEYDTSSLDPEENDPRWYGSTVILQDGFVYFVDEYGITVDTIQPYHCFFKARHMKYRIIPD